MKRVQRKWYGEKLPPNTKLVARPSRWGNQYKLKKHGGNFTLKQSLQRYARDVKIMLKINPEWLDPLIGFDLACYCNLEEPCHADILLEILKEKEKYKPNQHKITEYLKI